MMADLTKICRDCGIAQPVNCFYMNKGIPQNPCKSCVKLIRKNEYANDKEKIKRKNQLSYSKHRENRLASMSKYRTENKESISQAKKNWWAINRDKKLIEKRKKWIENREENLLISKRWRDKNKEWIKNYNKEYVKQNYDSLKIKRKAYYDKNKEKILSLVIDWQQRNKSSYKAWKKAWTANYRAQHREYHAKKQSARNKALSKGFTPKESAEMLVKQQGLCNICGVDISGNYHHDHIKPLSKGGFNTIDNIQLLCPSCNLKKGAMDNDVFIKKIKGCIS